MDEHLPSPFSSFHGERCLLKDDSVTYITPQDEPKAGTLYLTNFRLLFKCKESDEHTFQLSLGAVDKYDKIGGSTSRGAYAYGIEIQSKDLRSIRLAHNPKIHSRRRLFELLGNHVFPLSNGNSPYCIHYRGRHHLRKEAGNSLSKGWQLYSVHEEARRMGIPEDKWRISKVNEQYTLCPTYPKYLIVPTSASDDDLRAVARFRSKGRLPVHLNHKPVHNILSRLSCPVNKISSPNCHLLPSIDCLALCWYNRKNGATITRCSQPRVGVVGKRNQMDEKYINAIRELNPTHRERLRIMDARPRRNAMANQAKGLGYESTSAYPHCDIVFLNIHNIHVMRDSLRKVRSMCWPEPDEQNWFSNLEATGWLKHIRAILAGATSIAELVDVGHSVLIHCSDGWDRTSQLSAIAMLLLDPYYRTIEGFQVLIEKEWLSFGHKFGQRLGLCDKHHNDEQNSRTCNVFKLQRSPVFLQFVDCVWQLTEFFPCSFEFNESMLIFILDEMYSCFYGTFMYNSEKAREELRTNSLSLWDHIHAFRHEFVSPFFDADMEPTMLSYPVSMRNLQLWQSYFLRWSVQFRPKESLAARLEAVLSITKQLELEYCALQKSLQEKSSASSSASGERKPVEKLSPLDENEQHHTQHLVEEGSSSHKHNSVERRNVEIKEATVAESSDVGEDTGEITRNDNSPYFREHMIDN